MPMVTTFVPRLTQGSHRESGRKQRATSSAAVPRMAALDDDRVAPRSRRERGPVPAGAGPLVAGDPGRDREEREESQEAHGREGGDVAHGQVGDPVAGLVDHEGGQEPGRGHRHRPEPDVGEQGHRSGKGPGLIWPEIDPRGRNLVGPCRRTDRKQGACRARRELPRPGPSTGIRDHTRLYHE